jgi:hypothetical protein
VSTAVTVPVVLCALALLDAGFAGFRGSIGRDAGLVDHRFNLGSAAWGVGFGVVGLVLIAGCSLPWLLRVETRHENYQSLLTAGGRMLLVYAPMAAVNLVAISIYVLATNHEVRAVAMTLVLGPFTLLRIPVIAAGAIWAGMSSDLAAVQIGAVVAATATLAVGPVVGWWRFHRRGDTPSP